MHRLRRVVQRRFFPIAGRAPSVAKEIVTRVASKTETVAVAVASERNALAVVHVDKPDVAALTANRRRPAAPADAAKAFLTVVAQAVAAVITATRFTVNKSLANESSAVRRLREERRPGVRSSSTRLMPRHRWMRLTIGRTLLPRGNSSVIANRPRKVSHRNSIGRSKTT